MLDLTALILAFMTWSNGQHPSECDSKHLIMFAVEFHPYVQCTVPELYEVLLDLQYAEQDFE